MLDDPKWFTKPNPADALKPLIDIGTCSLTENDQISCTTDNGDKLKHMSPLLQQITGPHELFEYWKFTTPAPISSSRDEF